MPKKQKAATTFHNPSDIRAILLPVFAQYNVRRAILFGSYAKGTANNRSDVDLLVDSGLRGLKFVSLCEDVRLALGCEIDMLDIEHIEKGSSVEKEISDAGVIIYE